MFECPVPEPVSDRIQMAHGGGGRLMNELIRSVFLSAFGCPSGGVQNDAAVLEIPPGRLQPPRRSEERRGGKEC